jgi:hypothetical protein
MSNHAVAGHSDIASGKDDRRPGFQAALARCRRLDRITRRAHTPSGLLEEGYAMRAADMPGADDLMMRIYAAMAQKERELISECSAAPSSAMALGPGFTEHTIHPAPSQLPGTPCVFTYSA